MKIEEGKYYKTRDGRKVGPMVRGRAGSVSAYWTCRVNPLEDAAAGWFECGSFWPDGHINRNDRTMARDLIEEWRDPIDVYTIPTMPFGLLTPEQQQALRDHDGVIEFYAGKGWDVASTPAWLVRYTYRAKPKSALVPDTVPWDAIDARYVRYHRTNTGMCWIGEELGLDAGGTGVRIDGLLSGHSIGNMPATDATQYRPGYKP
jgi:hypothetical protein